ncbi:hypothetical protein JCM10207_001647 [Rhodosporidiobolus poonsookiae]
MDLDLPSPLPASAPFPTSGAPSPAAPSPPLAGSSQPAAPSHPPLRRAPSTQVAQATEGEQAPLVTVVHKVTVPAVHRLFSPSFSLDDNRKRYGACAMAVHGHDYAFEVKFRGPVCRATGKLMGSELLEDVVTMAIVEVLSRKNLDTDISFFLTRPSTLENVCLFAYRNISVLISPHVYDVCEVSVECEPCPVDPKAGADGSLRSGVMRTRVAFSGEMVSVPSET